MNSYCKNLFEYNRRHTRTVVVGGVAMGGTNPVVVQSMTTAKTEDALACVDQAISIFEAGAQLVRLTAQGRGQAENLSVIKQMIASRGYMIPLVADIHFNPEAAYIAAKYIDKVRINPGNFASADNMRDKLGELIKICKECKRALRIGVNHGSLASRIVERWGDTPAGMVESAMEYLRLCREFDFWDVVVSFKSSNVRTMVEAYRLGAATMDSEGLNFPLHLGVTEAGSDEDGRIKSAVGIGALLVDGIGDTIRVSLTESPESEIPVARTIIEYCATRTIQNYIPTSQESLPYDPFVFSKRSATSVPIVVGGEQSTITPQDALNGAQGWVVVTLDDFEPEFLEWLAENPHRELVVTSENNNWTAEIRAAFVVMLRNKLPNPMIIRKNYEEKEYEKLQIYASIDFGSILIDGFGDGVWIENFGETLPEKLGLDILQATRMRMTKTEIISCPGCGRTLFDLPTTARKVKERLGGVAGLKIAVMGCIVNGHGEMADADYGYVGAGEGKVTLYKGGEIVERNIPQEQALERLAELVAE